MNCHGCGAEKDPAVPELYPFPDDHIVTDRPIRPIHTLEVEPTNEDADWRHADVCHACLHRIQPDMWINQEIWEDISPTTPFAQLPPAPSVGT